MTFTLLILLLAALESIMWVNGHTMTPYAMGFYKLRSVTSVNIFACHMKGWDDDIVNWKNEKEALLNFKIRTFESGDIIGSMSFQSQHYRIGLLINMNCSCSWDVLQAASANFLFNASFVYALVTDEPAESAVNSLEPLNIQFDSDVTLFAGDEIYDLHRTVPEKSLKALMCGKFDYDGVVSYSRPPRWDLDGDTIKAATVIKHFKWKEEGFQRFLDNKYHPEIDSLSRFPVVAHQLLEFLYNFKTDLTIAADWGYFDNETGHFDSNSMFGWLEQGKVDLGLTLSRLYPGRLDVAAYMPVTFKYKTCVIFRHPAAGASYDGFARPFSSTTWMVMGLTVVAASFVLCAIKHSEMADNPPNESGYTYSLFNVLAIISLQGSYINSLRPPARILSVSLHVFGLMLYSYYGAEVVGFLLTPSPRTITTVEKLIENRMDMWVENVSFHRNHFENNVGAKATKYYLLGIKGETRDKDKFIDQKIGLKMVQKGRVALYGSNTEMSKVIESTFSGPEICSLHSINMLDLPVAVTVGKTSPYREMYVKALSRFIEGGFLEAEHKRWHTARPSCIGAESTSPVKLEATLIAQLLFAGGLALTIVVFICEKMVNLSRGRKSQQRRVEFTKISNRRAERKSDDESQPLTSP